MQSKLTLEDQLNEHVLHQACSEPNGVKYDVEETELTAVKRVRFTWESVQCKFLYVILYKIP